MTDRLCLIRGPAGHRILLSRRCDPHPFAVPRSLHFPHADGRGPSPAPAEARRSCWAQRAHTGAATPRGATGPAHPPPDRLSQALRTGPPPQPCSKQHRPAGRPRTSFPIHSLGPSSAHLVPASPWEALAPSDPLLASGQAPLRGGSGSDTRSHAHDQAMKQVMKFNTQKTALN